MSQKDERKRSTGKTGCREYDKNPALSRGQWFSWIFPTDRKIITSLELPQLEGKGPGMGQDRTDPTITASSEEPRASQAPPEALLCLRKDATRWFL